MKYKIKSAIVLCTALLLSMTLIGGASGASLALPNASVLQDTNPIYGDPWAWGQNNYGQLGDGTTINRSTPVQVSGLEDVIAVAGGWDHSLALKVDGTVWAWGANGYGQLGDGNSGYVDYIPIIEPAPVQVMGPGGGGYLTGIIDIAAGNSISLALDFEGRVWAWGNNTLGQLGNGDGGWIGGTVEKFEPYPVQVLGVGGVGFLTDVAAIACGNTHSLALMNDGTVLAWGSNNISGTNIGILGVGSASAFVDVPAQVKGPGGVGYLNGIAAIDGGAGHSLALKADGTVWAWGANTSGKLGDGTTTNRFTPVQVLGVDGDGDGVPDGFLTGVSAIASGFYNHNLAVLNDGTVLAWGNNGSGRLGDGTMTNRSTPVQVLGVDGVGVLTDVIAVAGGNSHSLALKSDGTVYAWGLKTYGLLGDGASGGFRATPTRSNGLANVNTIDCGYMHSLALGFGNTPHGANVAVQFLDEVAGTELVNLTFSEVTATGATTFNRSTTGPTRPAGFSIGDPAVYYNIATSAAYTGDILVCINHPGVTNADRLFHYEDGAWVDVTVSVDTANGIICGVVSSLSPFVVGRPDPTTTNVVANPNPAPIDTPVTLTADIDDTGTGGSIIASAEYSLDGGVAWTLMSAADGAFDSPTEAVTAVIGLFGVPQVIEILVRGTDAAGNTGAPASVLLAVYDPSAGFVTGGGWIWSPAGAYAAQPSLEGRASFGFVSRYQKGQSIPDGNTQFQFQAADLKFHSTNYDWLLIAGYRAQFKGSGTINDQGDYGFMLTAIDGNLTPSQDYDSFRIKIWDKVTGEVIYDNQMGTSDSGNASTALGGGSIVIHK